MEVQKVVLDRVDRDQNPVVVAHDLETDESYLVVALGEDCFDEDLEALKKRDVEVPA